MTTITDSELCIYIEFNENRVQDQEATFLSKANGQLGSANPNPGGQNVSPADDWQKIAKDALAVLQSFEDVSSEIGSTNGAAVKKQWDTHYASYRNMLEDTLRLAQQGSAYLKSFNDGVLAKLSPNGTDWAKDKALLDNFLKNDKEGRTMVTQANAAIQKFATVKAAIETFRNIYPNNAGNNGQAYSSKLKELNDSRGAIQSQINSNRVSSAQIRTSMQRTAGPGFLQGWLTRSSLSVMTIIYVQANQTLTDSYQTLGADVFNQANNRVAQREREEQDLVKKRDAIDSQGNSLVKNETPFGQVRYAALVTVDKVSDISGRLTVLAQTWAEIVMQRMGLLKKAVPLLQTDFRKFIDALAPKGVIPQPDKKKPLTFDGSNMFGNSLQGGVVTLFDDTNPGIDPTKPIAEIRIVEGFFINGLHVTYRLKNGGTMSTSHGVVQPAAQARNVFVKLTETEYISAVTGQVQTNAAAGPTWQTMCIYHLAFEITDSASGAKRNTAGRIGKSMQRMEKFSRYSPISWKGRLFCFAGTAGANLPHGIRGIKFIQVKP
ncbi:hypothetical protein RHS03_10034, partial [Rhizoctonia solani]